MEKINVETRGYWMTVINTLTGLKAIKNVDYSILEKSWGFEIQGKDLTIIYLLSHGSPKFNKKPALITIDGGGNKSSDIELGFPNEGILNCSAEIAMEYLKFDTYEEKKEEILEKWVFLGFKIPVSVDVDYFKIGLLNLLKIANWEQAQVLKNSFPQYFR
jgi:hypothetical protein